MGELTHKKSLPSDGLKQNNIVTNSGLEVNSDWGVQTTQSEITSNSIDNSGNNAEKVVSEPNPKRIMINYKRIKSAKDT